jgi:endonuclease YncB( thermonuclease family)
LVAVSACCLFAAQRGFADEIISGTVVGVHDGDTLTVLTPEKTEIKVRLEGIDAPESKQPFGSASKASLSAMTFGRQVRLECGKTDRFRRKVCRVFQGTTDVNREQLKRGMAWHFNKYADEQPAGERQADDEAETNARARSLGVFSQPNPQAPWDFRRPR